MPYDAVVQSPLGPILLQAEADGLLGLYFTDQPDSPLQKQPARSPAAGTLGVRKLSSCKVELAIAGSDSQISLWDTLSKTGMAAKGSGHGSDPGAAMRLLQDDTPDGAVQILQQAGRQLNEYWQHKRKVFDLPLQPVGTTFQKRVWQALLDVPYGHTLAYGELARRAGFTSGHSRAVGAAVGSNPISIVMPCHRILAGNGTLNGYGGGLERKLLLLELEGYRISPS